MNGLNGIDETKLQNAVEMMKQILGKDQAAKIEKLFENKTPGNLNLSEKELKAVKTIIENPDMLKTILSSRKAREVLMKHLDKI